MKYYFFIDNGKESNLVGGKTYHAAGYVGRLYCDLDNPNHSGKDLTVRFFDPFEGAVTCAWRAVSEVELFEVDEFEYQELVKRYDAINTIN